MVEQRISIAMCTYNGKPYLTEQLESILAQDRLPDEIVICDDGSSDGTWEMLEEYRRRFPQLVKLYRNSNNLGPARNFERAIELCTGDLIALCDQDDVWRRDKLGKLTRWFEEDSGLGLVFSNAERINVRGGKLDTDLWEIVGFGERAKAEARDGRALQTFLRRPAATGCTMMLRATLKKECLPIGEPLMHDHWISLVAAATSRIGFVDERLLGYRQHTANEVGAPQLSLRQRTEVSQRLGISQCMQDVVGLGKLVERLGSEEREQTSLIQQKIEFLEFRISLWSDETFWLRKAYSLIREILLGRYRRWSNGWRTLAKDLAVLLWLTKQPDLVEKQR